MQFPEADRTRVWMRVFSAELLRTAKEGDNGNAADTFDWKGDRYEIRKVDDWLSGMSILEHCEALAVRKELTPN